MIKCFASLLTKTNCLGLAPCWLGLVQFDLARVGSVWFIELEAQVETGVGLGLD